MDPQETGFPATRVHVCTKKLGMTLWLLWWHDPLPWPSSRRPGRCRPQLAGLGPKGFEFRSRPRRTRAALGVASGLVCTCVPFPRVSVRPVEVSHTDRVGSSRSSWRLQSLEREKKPQCQRTTTFDRPCRRSPQQNRGVGPRHRWEWWAARQKRHQRCC